MGIDFIEKAAPTFKKSWDRARVTLGTADLFTLSPDRTVRIAAAHVIGDAELRKGDQLTVEILDGAMIARRGNRNVARFSNPPPVLVQAVRASSGIAKGTVEQVHNVANVAEISLC